MSLHKKFLALSVSLLSLISFGCSHDSSPEAKAPDKPKIANFNLTAIDSRLNAFKNKLAELEQCLANQGVEACDVIAAQLNSL